MRNSMFVTLLPKYKGLPVRQAQGNQLLVDAPRHSHSLLQGVVKSKRSNFGVQGDVVSIF
jgi:hypothetical protein